MNCVASTLRIIIKKMDRIPIWVLLISLFLLIHSTESAVLDQVKFALIDFVKQLSNTDGIIDPSLGWNLTSDPCQDRWKGVICDGNSSVRKIWLTSHNISGFFYASSLCSVLPLATSLSVIRIEENSVTGEITSEISRCTSLRHLSVRRNQLYGPIPESIVSLKGLRRLDISYNMFYSSLPDLSRIRAFRRFLAQHNFLSGKIPGFDFSRMREFNVSYNDFSGLIPDVKGRFDATSFMNNPRLCGLPLPNPCPAANPTHPPTIISSGVSKHRILLNSGLSVLGFGLLIFM